VYGGNQKCIWTCDFLWKRQRKQLNKISMNSFDWFLVKPSIATKFSIRQLAFIFLLSHYMFWPPRAILRWDIQLDVSMDCPLMQRIRFTCATRCGDVTCCFEQTKWNTMCINQCQRIWYIYSIPGMLNFDTSNIMFQFRLVSWHKINGTTLQSEDIFYLNMDFWEAVKNYLSGEHKPCGNLSHERQSTDVRM
jgi:hypothetical protein